MSADQLSELFNQFDQFNLRHALRDATCHFAGGDIV